VSPVAGALTRRRDPGSDGFAPIRPPTGRRDRRSLVLVASLALVCASIAAFVGLYSSADHKTPAVVLVRSLAQGQPITQADLGEADVAVSAGVGFIPVSQASMLAGKRAVAAIPSGSLLTMADVTGAPAIGPSDAVVGIALKQGAFPASGLSPGDLVMVVQTAGPGTVIAAPSTGVATATGGALAAGSSGTVTVTGTGTGTATGTGTGTGTGSVGGGAVGTGVLIPSASVVAVASPGGTSSGGYSLLVSIEVLSSTAADVATAATAGQVSLVLLPRSPVTGSVTP